MTTESLYRATLIAGAAACLVVGALPTGSALGSMLYETVVLAIIVVLAFAAIRAPRDLSSVWWAALAYVVLSNAGDVVYSALSRSTVPSPGPADAFYVAAYVAAGVSLALLIRRAGSELRVDAWIDASILAIAGAAVVGVAVLEPILTTSEQTGFAEFVSVLYPLLDLVLLSGLLRLVVAGTRQDLTVILLAAAFAVTLVADLIFSSRLAQDVGGATSWMDAVYLFAYVLMASAALARNSLVGWSPRPSSRSTGGQGGPNYIAIAAAVLVLPALITIRSWADRAIEMWLVGIALMAAAVVLLSLWRLNLLLHVVEDQAETLAVLSRTDSLTGLPNRRAIDAELARRDEFSVDNDTPFVLAVIDLDQFRLFNDEFGHQAGDDALINCAKAWSLVLTESQPAADATLARYSGEEFVVLLRGMAALSARPTLERLRRTTPDDLSVSIGFAVNGRGESAFEMMRAADRALYTAKRLGRDQIVMDSAESRTK